MVLADENMRKTIEAMTTLLKNTHTIPVSTFHIPQILVPASANKNKKQKTKQPPTIYFYAVSAKARTCWVTRYLSISFDKTFRMDVINQIIMDGIKFSIEQWLDDFLAENAVRRLILMNSTAMNKTTKPISKIGIELFCQSDWKKVVFNRSKPFQRQAIS